MNLKNILPSPIIPPQIVPLIRGAGHSSVPILIFGERGVGKERVARVIHQSGEWKDRPFYRVDCKMLKENTFSSQLAYILREIRFGAIPATLFCEEVGRLKHGDQLKLLELIEEGVFGSNGEKWKVKNLRWIASSSEDLKEKVIQGTFSEDLYDGLNRLPIHLPPLRDRIEDIPSIARHLLAEQATRMNLRAKDLSPSVLSLFQSYWWPGNLRELERVIVQMALSSGGENLTEKDLPLGTKIGNHSVPDFLERQGSEKPLKRKETSSNGNKPVPYIFFLAELVQRIKDPLVAINTFTRLLGQKFDDFEFRKSFHREVSEDIEKIDLVLNSLLNYIKMSTPLNKSDTIQQTLEEVLRRHEDAFKTKGVKIFKKYEKGLPETVIPEVQLRYVLHSLMEYILSILPLRGSIGCLTKLVREAEETKETKGEGIRPVEERQRIEVLIVFTGFKRPSANYETIFGVLPTSPEEDEELELKLIHEIINRNKGRMVVEVNEKKPRTVISLRLPVERRRVIYYQTANI